MTMTRVPGKGLVFVMITALVGCALAPRVVAAAGPTVSWSRPRGQPAVRARGVILRSPRRAGPGRAVRPDRREMRCPLDRFVSVTCALTGRAGTHPALVHGRVTVGGVYTAVVDRRAEVDAVALGRRVKSGPDVPAPQTHSITFDVTRFPGP